MHDKIKDNFAKLSDEKKAEFIERLKKDGRKYGIFPLSEVQKSILYFYIMDKDNTSYNIRFLLRFSKGIDTALLERAIGETIRCNPTLRTKLLSLNDEYFQMVEEYSGYKLSMRDAKDIDAVYAELEADSRKGFELEEEYPIRAEFFRLEDEDVLSVCLHHMFSDGWSVEILVSELRKYYEALLKSDISGRAPVKKVYTDCMYSDESGECREFWTAHVKGYELPDIPTVSECSDHTALSRAVYTARLTDRKELDELSDRYDVTSYCLLLGLYFDALHQWCRQKRLGVGMAVLNRHTPDEMKSIGLYANTLPVTDEFNEQESLGEHLRSLQAELKSIIAYSAVDTNDIMRGISAGDTASNNSVYRTVFLMAEKRVELDSIGGVEVYLENIDNSDRIPFDVQCCAESDGDAFSLRFDYREGLVSVDSIKELVDIYLSVFEKAKLGQRIEPVFENEEKKSTLTDILVVEETTDDGSSEISEKIRAVWAKLLGNDDFSDDDNFFKIGGNSILCIKLASALNKVFDRKIKVTDIFKNYDIKKLTSYYAEEK